jgi:hypothetical protein
MPKGATGNFNKKSPTRQNKQATSVQPRPQGRFSIRHFQKFFGSLQKGQAAVTRRNRWVGLHRNKGGVTVLTKHLPPKIGDANSQGPATSRARLLIVHQLGHFTPDGVGGSYWPEDHPKAIDAEAARSCIGEMRKARQHKRHILCQEGLRKPPSKFVMGMQG